MIHNCKDCHYSSWNLGCALDHIADKQHSLVNTGEVLMLCFSKLDSAIYGVSVAMQSPSGKVKLELHDGTKLEGVIDWASIRDIEPSKLIELVKGVK